MTYFGAVRHRNDESFSQAVASLSLDALVNEYFEKIDAGGDAE